MVEAQSVSAVIPVFNGLVLLQKNLPLVVKALRNKDELILVDDASQDETLAFLKKEYSLSLSAQSEFEFERWQGVIKSGKKEVPLVVISNKENLRFAQSVNRGVEQAQYRLVLLLNTDVLPKADLLDFLIPHFQDPQVFGVGCAEIESEQNAISAGKNKLWFSRGLFVHSRADEFKAGATAWVSGGSGMFDRRKWLELGGFDPIYYPAYWEDVDLSFRARKKGWKVLFEPLAVVYHEHETTNQDVFGQAKIDAMSWKHAQSFALRNGNWKQRAEFFIWYPYWFLKRILKQSSR